MKKHIQPHIDEVSMLSILDHTISDDTRDVFKDHINVCQKCWSLWNKVRWDRAMNSKGMLELREYMGDAFSTYYDSSWALANEWNLEKRRTKNDVESFYQKTNNYLYNLVVFYESGDRKNFTPLLQKLRGNPQIKTVIDYGCGVGNDSLDLVKAGFRVISVDFKSPSLDFLRWRLGKRGISKEQCRVVSVERLDSYAKELQSVDMFWGVDVLEHMFDPFEIFKILPSDLQVFAYFVDSDDKAGGRHPFHFAMPTQEFEARLHMLGLKRSLEYYEDIPIWTR